MNSSVTALNQHNKFFNMAESAVALSHILWYKPINHLLCRWSQKSLDKSKKESLRDIMNVVCRPHKNIKEVSAMDKNSLSHTTWECKYHLVFAPKYRRQVIYGKIRDDVGKILRELCDRKGIEIIEAECCKDHVHMLVRIPPKIQCGRNNGISQREK